MKTEKGRRRERGREGAEYSGSGGSLSGSETEESKAVRGGVRRNSREREKEEKRVFPQVSCSLSEC